MKIRCVWEHNGDDSILYAENFIGAFARGVSRDLVIQKMPSEIQSYLRWKGDLTSDFFEPEIVQEKRSGLTISDADADVLFEEERKELSPSEYADLKLLVLKSAHDFLALYQAIPDKNKSCLPIRAVRLFLAADPCTRRLCTCGRSLKICQHSLIAWMITRTVSASAPACISIRSSPLSMLAAVPLPAGLAEISVKHTSGSVVTA